MNISDFQIALHQIYMSSGKCPSNQALLFASNKSESIKITDSDVDTVRQLYPICTRIKLYVITFVVCVYPFCVADNAMHISYEMSTRHTRSLRDQCPSVSFISMFTMLLRIL